MVSSYVFHNLFHFILIYEMPRWDVKRGATNQSREAVIVVFVLNVLVAQLQWTLDREFWNQIYLTAAAVPKLMNVFPME